MASDRDRHAAQLRHTGLPYEQIAERLGFTDRRAAHRGVARGLAEPGANEAMASALAWREMDQRLQELQRRMLAWLEQNEALETLQRRTYFKVVNALSRVSVQRCRLWGLFTQPWRYDQWYRRDLPQCSWWDLHRLSAKLERQTRIPPRYRSPTVAEDLAPVVPLRPMPERDAGLESLVPASVWALLTKTA